MTFQEYSRWQQRKAMRDYFREKAGGGGVAGDPDQPDNRRLIPKIYLGPMADRIFGGSYVDIRPAGRGDAASMGYRGNRNDNPALTLRQQSVGDFQFDQNMNLNLTGQIGHQAQADVQLRHQGGLRLRKPDEVRLRGLGDRHYPEGGAGQRELAAHQLAGQGGPEPVRRESPAAVWAAGRDGRGRHRARHRPTRCASRTGPRAGSTKSRPASTKRTGTSSCRRFSATATTGRCATCPPSRAG